MGSNSKKKGVTLVELIVTIAVLTVVYAIIYVIFSAYTKMYYSGVNKNDTQVSGTKILFYVSRDISEAQDVETSGYTIPSSKNFSGDSWLAEITPFSQQEDGTSSPNYYIVFDGSGHKLYMYWNDSNYKLLGDNVYDAEITLDNSYNSSQNKNYKVKITTENGNVSKDFITTVSTESSGNEVGSGN